MAQGNRSSNFKVEFGDEQVKQVKEVEQIEQEHRESKVIKILYYLFSLRKNLLVEWCRPEIVARKTFYPKSAIILDCQPCGNFCPPLPLFQPKPVTLTITWSSTTLHLNTLSMCQCPVKRHLLPPSSSELPESCSSKSPLASRGPNSYQSIRRKCVLFLSSVSLSAVIMCHVTVSKAP